MQLHALNLTYRPNMNRNTEIFHVAASRAMHLAHLRLRDESFLIFPSYVNPQNMAAHAAEVEE